MARPKEIDFGFVYDDSKLWSLDLPVEEIPIEDLEHNLDIKYWEKEGTDDWNLTLREFISDPKKNPCHYKALQGVNMKYPIVIFLFDGSWNILDGAHRYCKAILEGRKTIKVRRVTEEMIPKIVKN